MIKRNRLVLATVLAGSLGLATLGVVRATAMDSEVDPTAITAISADDSSATTLVPMMMGRGMHHMEMFQDQAELFKMSVDDLIKEMQAGKPMYQIAADHGVTYTNVKEQRLAEFKTQLDAMVKVGYMTQQQADELYQQMQTQPMLGLGFGHHGGRWER